MQDLATFILIGIFATATIDLWATFSNKVLKLPRTNWAMVGRWLGHIPKGKLVHSPISNAEQLPYENITGWAFHYLIGIAYALIYFLLVVGILNLPLSLLSAWLFGVSTILSPWLIMQPCLGMGFCANRAPWPTGVRLQNFALHSIFGIALYLGFMWF